MGKSKWHLAVGCGALLLATAAAAETDALGRIKQRGHLIVAVDPTYPPMESEDDKGQLAGFDVDLARRLGQRLGVDTRFMVMSYDGILTGLQTSRYDLIISAMNVTAERAKQVDFVEYARMAQLFVAKPGVVIERERDLAQRIVAVATDTTSFEYVHGLGARGIKLADLKGFRLMSDVFMAVKAGHAAVLVCDEPVARHFVKADPKSFGIAGRAMAPEPLGIAVRKGERALYEAVAAAIAAMKKDGTMRQLEESWFGAALGS